MRLVTLFLDAYGRFNDHVVELKPGLQLLLGPNEQGKSTIRNFVTDMLYGQRRGPQLRNFDEANELRRPWNGSERYSGRLVYSLDGGREIEVQRDFDKKRGSVSIFDRTHMRNITADCQHLKNREPNFAEEHLGLTKAVFISTATIGPMSLDDLGDDDALAQIREKILSLADTSDESGTAESALRILSDRAAEIGRPVSHSKKPLPLARARLDKLEQELVRARAASTEIASIEARLSSAAEKLEAQKKKKTSLEEELRALDRKERAQRLAEAERVQMRIDEVTQTGFKYSSLREFPLEQAADVQRAANAAATARAQAERTSSELAEIEHQLATETETLEAGGVPHLVEIADTTEQELSALDGKIVRLRERIEELTAELARAQDRLARAQQDLQALPDFSRIGADPVAWLTQLATSFRVARQARYNSGERHRRVHAELERRRADIAPLAKLFADFHDFAAESRNHDVAKRLNDERIAQLTSEMEALRIEADEGYASGPYSLWTAGIFGGVALACAGAAIWFQLPYVFGPAIAAGLTMTIALARWVWSRKTARNAERDADRLQENLAHAENERASSGERIEPLIAAAGVGSLRELEALHDRYSRERSELESLTASEAQLAQDAHEECTQVENLFAKIQETFLAVGESVEHEDDIDSAAARAMSRYQEYRDAKRRLGESRDRPAQLQEQLASAQSELQECQHLEVDRALAVRHVLREAGFREEARYTNVLAAVQAYHVRTSQVRDKLGRVAVLRERTAALRARLEAEQRDASKQDAALASRLRAANAESIDHWQELAKQAKQFRDARDERVRLQERLDSALRGETLAALRALIEKEGTGAGSLARNNEEVKLDLRKCTFEIESLTNEEHDLKIALAQKTAGQRSLNEVEEERDETAARVAELELEAEATGCAAALIESAARDRHARIAPRIATAAGQYLGRITQGAYTEVMVDRELRISVRIPKTAKLSDDPKRMLSKGTVDQVYLALRLSILKAMSAGGESVPLLLDDPFANYDDARLARALEVLTEIGTMHQILLFTCRQDVARAAAALHVPIVNV